MRNNDRGFTLVELIVSIALLGIIAVAAAGFLVTGTRTYTSVNYSVRLQYETQLAMNQIQDYVMNCSQGIAWEGSTLCIVNSDNSLQEIGLKGDQKLYYIGNETAASDIGSITPNDLMAENVTAFGVTFSPAATDTPQKVTTATVTLTMERGGKSYTGTQTIALRNEPLAGTNWENLWAKLPADA
ncbi:MAG: prepilin-type N-terminal cleavage/methylation domain-containing protein [Oscillospiraceae bacterium]|nr:prepilin-type N-terminal cleavage/methylation domain-containing protein [Oscillospiraceae bacterium]